MKHSTPALLLAALCVGHLARADGLSAAAQSVADGAVRDATVHLGAAAGSAGVEAAVISSRHFAYFSYDWVDKGVEVGLGFDWLLIGPLRLYVASGWILLPRSEPTGGGRVLAGIAARFGDRLFIRPGLGASFAVVGSQLTDSFSLPIEASAEGGYAWPFLSIYVRLAGRIDPIAHPKPSLGGEASLGVMVPLGR